MSDFANDAIYGVNCKAVAEFRRSILGEADLRAQWMDEYGIETIETETVREERELQPIRRSARREYLR
jgi:hypothetical protein